MRYSKIETYEITNGVGIGVSLFVQGCPIHCKGCFNPETWNFLQGKDFTIKSLMQIIQALDKPYINRFSVLGGEPLCSSNREEVLHICALIKDTFPNIRTWMYSGYTLEYLQHQNIQWNDIDYLVCGPFIQKQKDLSLAFRGSRNQQIIDVRQMLDISNQF